MKLQNATTILMENTVLEMVVKSNLLGRCIVQQAGIVLEGVINIMFICNVFALYYHIRIFA